MTGQMSLFDNLETLPEEDMVSRIGDALGIEFKYKDDMWGWEHHISKNHVYRIQYGRYSVDDHDRFISCEISHGHSGACAPMDSIEEAVGWFQRTGERI